MHALSYALFVLALSAQAPAPVAQPEWLAELQKIQREIGEAPLGSLEPRVERAWRAALETPEHRDFPMAVQMVAGVYQSQGYDLKAEQVWRQALAAVPAGAARTRRNLTAQLAAHFENAQQLLKALAVREEMAKQPPVADDPSGNYEATSLAALYERLGQAERAEAAWKEAAAKQFAPRAQNTPGFFWHGNRGGTGSVLASFYTRQGRFAEAEQLYTKDLAGAAQGGSAQEWSGAANGYVDFLLQQRRFDEAIALVRQSILRLEGSSEPQAAQAALSKRQQLVYLLRQAGRPEEALSLGKEAVELAQARGVGSPEHIQATGALVETLIAHGRLDEAERAVAGMREAAAADQHSARFHESMAAQMLARIRDMQKRPEEARQLRESAGIPHPLAQRELTIFDLAGPAQQAALRGDIDGAIAASEKAAALASERGRSHPQEVAALIGLASALTNVRREAEARRMVVEAHRILEEAPDHPRVAEALGSIIPALAQWGMAAEAERALVRQEKILAAAKGSDSPALNAVSYGRITMMQRDSNWAGVIEERRRMLSRVEKATGPGSRESLYALREVAWAYPVLNNWPEEEAVLAALAERTVNVCGASSLETAHIRVHMANRASQNRRFDEALTWMDRAIEIARALPDAGSHLPAMIQNREMIVQAQQAPPGGPFYGPSGAVGSSAGRWFDSDRFQRTDGTRLSGTPTRGVLVVRPASPPDGAPKPAAPQAEVKK